LLFNPSSHQLIISGNIVFKKTFFSAIAETWHPLQDSLMLCPVAMYVLTITLILEMTSLIDSILLQCKEGKEELVGANYSLI